jgi:hypothetical protein
MTRGHSGSHRIVGLLKGILSTCELPRKDEILIERRNGCENPMNTGCRKVGSRLAGLGGTQD